MAKYLSPEEKLAFVLDVIKGKDKNEACGEYGVQIEEADLWIDQFIKSGKNIFRRDSEVVRIKNLFEQIKKKSEIAQAVFQSDDLESAILIAYRAFMLIKTVCDIFHFDSESKFIEDHQKSFEDDLAELSKANLQNQPILPGFDSTRFSLLMTRLQQYIGSLETEMNSAFAEYTPWKRFYRQSIRIFLTHKLLFISVLIIVGALVSYAVYAGRQESRKRGIMGEYYSDKEFRNLVHRRKDEKINFNWRTASPTPLMKDHFDHFAVRWSGYLRVKKAGTYEFTARSDDGARLWIDDKLVVDDWGYGHELKSVSGIILLEKGYHKIRVDYFENEGGAAMHLSWKHESDSKSEIIGGEYLYSIAP